MTPHFLTFGDKQGFKNINGVTLDSLRKLLITIKYLYQAKKNHKQKSS